MQRIAAILLAALYAFMAAKNAYFGEWFRCGVAGVASIVWGLVAWMVSAPDVASFRLGPIRYARCGAVSRFDVGRLTRLRSGAAVKWGWGIPVE